MHSVVHAASGESGYQTFTLNAGEWGWLIFSAAVAVLAICVGLVLVRGVLAADEGTPTMREIAKAIQEGAMAYLRRQFRTIGIILVPVAILVFATSHRGAQAQRLDRARRSRAVGHLPHARVHRRRVPLGPHRLHRHEPRGARQRPDRGRRPDRARCPAH